MKIAERTASWRRERRVLLRVSRAAWRLEQAERERSWALASARAEEVAPALGTPRQTSAMTDNSPEYDRDTCKSGNGSIFLRCSRRSTLIRCRDVPRRSETSRLPRSPDSEVNSVRDFRDSAGERPLSVGISFRDQNHDRLMAGFTRTSAAPVQARSRAERPRPGSTKARFAEVSVKNRISSSRVISGKPRSCASSSSENTRVANRPPQRR
jgi:hypothetical protein